MRYRKVMGTFHVDIEVGRPGRATRWTLLKRVMVDSGAEITWLPDEVLRRLGIGVFKKDECFITADGRQVTRDIGVALIRIKLLPRMTSKRYARKLPAKISISFLNSGYMKEITSQI